MAVDYPPAPISDFNHLIAVITGGGSGMGRELTRQLAAAGCSVAICDLSTDDMHETIELATAAATDGGLASPRFTAFTADVSDTAAMDAFATHVRDEFRTDHINLLFNNAGLGGGGSFVESTFDAWNHTFDVCWGGVLNGSRAFRELLLAADRGQIINTSSVNGLWACLGPNGPHTAYSAAKFAVRGFTEALMIDFRINAPHLTAAVVMPGHIGTAIMRKSYETYGRDPKNLSDQHVAEIRADLTKRGQDLSAASDEDVRNLVALFVDGFEHAAPTTAAEAATIILDGVKSGRWRILVGDDADAIDTQLRDDPESAYTVEFAQRLAAGGHFTALMT